MSRLSFLIHGIFLEFKCEKEKREDNMTSGWSKGFTIKKNFLTLITLWEDL